MITVVLVDDHPAFLHGLAAMLEESGDVQVLASVSEGAAAIDAACRLRPDAVVMDLHLPGLDGIDATHRIVDEVPETAVLVLSMHDDDATVQMVLDAGARGYLLKEATGADIVRALQSVVRGEAVFGASVATRLLRRLGGAPPSVTSPFPRLTGRELEVLDLLARAKTNAEIASRLFLSDKTARNHVSNILTKLDVPDRAQAGELARAAGLGIDLDVPTWRAGSARKSRHQ